MWWRESRREFEENGNAGNKKAIRAIVRSGQVPGILAYQDERAIGWCSVAPRDTYPSLNRSPVLRKLDDIPVWSIVCFYIAKEYRDQNLTEALIRAAIDYVHEQGGEVVEAYPTVPRKGTLPPISSYMGVPEMFERVGFKTVARPSQAKAILRFTIGD